MKKLDTFNDIITANIYKAKLESADIDILIKNDYPPGISIALGNQLPELWVIHDQDLARARKIIQQIDQPVQTNQSYWTCKECGEKLDAQFNECWQCGQLRD